MVRSILPSLLNYYDEELLSLGFAGDQIRQYGFAFEGKRVLIG